MSDRPVCGAPRSRREGTCERRVPRDGFRCPHHPRTGLEAAEAPAQPAVTDGGAPVGFWPDAEDVGVVSAPVRPLSDGAGEGDHAE